MKHFLILAFIAAASAFVIFDQSPQCDLEWRFYDYTNSCYFQGDFQSFDAAEKSCTSMGSHLASVQTQFESSFVQALTETGEKQNQEGMTWIGLHYENNAVKGQWDTTECKNKERKYVCKKASNW